MTTTTTNTTDHQSAAEVPTRIFAQWGLPHTVTPRFGARLIQEHHRLHFLSDRASLVGEWAEETIDLLEAAFPTIIKELEGKLLMGELDARCQQRITLQHEGFTCEADTLGSHGYVYATIFRIANPDLRLHQNHPVESWGVSPIISPPTAPKNITPRPIRGVVCSLSNSIKTTVAYRDLPVLNLVNEIAETGSYFSRLFPKFPLRFFNRAEKSMEVTNDRDEERVY